MKRILICTNYAKDQDLSFTLQVLSFLRAGGAEARAFFPMIPAETLPADLPEDIRAQFYSDETEDHVVYYGEIVSAYILED